METGKGPTSPVWITCRTCVLNKSSATSHTQLGGCRTDTSYHVRGGTQRWNWPSSCSCCCRRRRHCHRGVNLHRDSGSNPNIYRQLKRPALTGLGNPVRSLC
uniref:Uncharacterized protein n=1 Tax=Physcomitrium patens TaxID=3218 RepID=A0A2K1JZK2_PHYPA|nr:hypothetical protein PHYPA_014075 [Physcomitrium patens]